MLTLLTNLQVLNNAGKLEPAQILIENSTIRAFTPGKTNALDGFFTNSQVLNLQGALVTPGLVDLHIHLREPGQEEKETIASGTAAAARGGWTTVCAMPNTLPDPHSPELLIELQERFHTHSIIKALPYSPITVGITSDKLVDFGAQARAGAIAFSNDGKGVQKAGVMWQAMQYASEIGLPIATHAEDESIIQNGVINAGDAATRLDLPGIHRLAETVQVARDVLIAEATGAHHHLCHASTNESMRIIQRALSDGVKVSAEVTPHHLLLSDNDILSDNANWKMNPPLRTPEDIQSLLDGIKNGTIVAIATDNAPHLPTEKNCSFLDGAFGVVTNEYSFALLYTKLVCNNKLSLKQLVDALTIGPATAYNLTAGTLTIGKSADLAAFALDATVTINPNTFVGKGRNSPFVNEKVKGDCIFTMCNGKIVYQNLHI